MLRDTELFERLVRRLPEGCRLTCILDRLAVFFVCWGGGGRGVQGLGFRGFRVAGLGFGVEGVGFRGGEGAGYGFLDHVDFFFFLCFLRCDGYGFLGLRD